MSLVVNDFDQDRQVRRELDEAGGVDHTARAESGDAMDDGRPGEALAPKPLQQSSRKRRMVKSVGLAKEDPDQELIAI
jgi:hypothetical protein